MSGRFCESPVTSFQGDLMCEYQWVSAYSLSKLSCFERLARVIVLVSSWEENKKLCWVPVLRGEGEHAAWSTTISCWYHIKAGSICEHERNNKDSWMASRWARDILINIYIYNYASKMSLQWILKSKKCYCHPLNNCITKANLRLHRFFQTSPVQVPWMFRPQAWHQHRSYPSSLHQLTIPTPPHLFMCKTWNTTLLTADSMPFLTTCSFRTAKHALAWQICR